MGAKFDKDGVLSGVTLTDNQQMKQMVDLDIAGGSWKTTIKARAMRLDM